MRQAIQEFGLLPCSSEDHWLVAADWLEEQGELLAAEAIRAGLREPEIIKYNITNNHTLSAGVGDEFTWKIYGNSGFGGGVRIEDNAASGAGNGDGTGNAMCDTMDATWSGNGSYHQKAYCYGAGDGSESGEGTNADRL